MPVAARLEDLRIWQLGYRLDLLHCQSTLSYIWFLRQLKVSKRAVRYSYDPSILIIELLFCQIVHSSEPTCIVVGSVAYCHIFLVSDPGTPFLEKSHRDLKDRDTIPLSKFT